MLRNSLMLATSAMLVLSASAAINSEIEDPNTAAGWWNLYQPSLQDLLGQATKDQEDESEGGARRLSDWYIVQCPKT